MNKKFLIAVGLIIIISVIAFVANFSLTGFTISEEKSSTNEIGEFSCKEFQEDVLWIMNYTNSPEGSINYRAWYPIHNCTELNVSDCFLENIYVETRFLRFGLNDEKGEGYIQISNPDESICESPAQGIYSKYLAYDTIIGEGKKFGEYCGDNKNSKLKCEIQRADNYNLNCYGIKIYGSQYVLVDSIKINYNLCSENGGER